jgi:hypothetical protein
MKDNGISESEANLFFEVFLAAKSIQEANPIGLTGARSYRVVKDSWI